MQGYQRVNHFPGMYAIARKSNLCMNLNKLRKRLPSLFNFYPRTWFLPSEYHDFSTYYNKNRGIFIVKPSASSQGKGIFIISDAEQVNSIGDSIVQEYIENPLLIEGLKFDMRIYVLVTSCEPLKIFIHREGLARFATEKYSKPAPWNMDKVCMHLTNYSLNKMNPKFIKNKCGDDDNTGHKRSLTSTLKYLQSQGHDIRAMWLKVCDIVIKTIASIQPSLSHTYKTCRPNDITKSLCFEILGFDILLDSSFTPWLLEVNHSPSFETSTPLDKRIKTQVISDSLKLLHLDPSDKKIFERKKKVMIVQRSVFRKSFYEKAQETSVEKQGIERDEDCETGFLKIFPRDVSYFNGIVECAKGIIEEFTGARKAESKKRPQTTGRISTTPQPGTRVKSMDKSPYSKLASNAKVLYNQSLGKKVKTKCEKSFM